MTKSKVNSFLIECPYCKHKNDFSGDDWNDDLTDTSEEHEVDCMECGKVMIVSVSAEYTHYAEKEDEDDND